MKKQWGIFCTQEQVDDMKKCLDVYKLETFEVRPLTAWEKMAYVPISMWGCGDIWCVMFWATKWQYRKFIRRNKLAKVF